MFGFIRALFGFTDRGEKEANRAAAAMDGIADDLESVREKCSAASASVRQEE